MPQNASSPQSRQTKPQNNTKSKQASSQSQNVQRPQQPKPQSKASNAAAEQDGGLKFFDKMKNKYTDWKTRRVIIKEAEAKAEKAVALNKFNRLKSQYGFKGGK